MLILILALLGTAAILLRRDHALALAELLPGRSVVLSSLGIGMELVGMRVGGEFGHGLVVLGLAALLAASWPLRRWTGGRLLILGLTLNAIAITLHGRMPITPEVLREIGIAKPIGTPLEGSKDIVAAGWVATWLGDRFILALPFLHYTIVWSLGDLLLIAGICRAATGQVRHEQFT
jgi:uncharacterized protein DUF5317